MYFEDLPLHDDILDALYDMNFEECTPIQEHTIPPLLEGKDLIGVAQTGTGKTAAYLLPVLSQLRSGNYPKDAINCIVMSPTRELAQQIDQAMQGFSYYLDGISSVAIYGGNDGIRYEQEKRSLQMGADVIIATPGRLISHLALGNLDLSKVGFFILDEADRMLDMGFYDDIMQIVKQLPVKRQTIMFSATMPQNIITLARTILHDPVEVKLAVSKPAEGISQHAYICYEAQKLPLILHLLKIYPPRRVILFAGKKTRVKDLTINLKRKNFNVEAMHSDLTQQERDAVMYGFKSGQIDILVATDIVARGIDIDDIQMVINFDVPHDEEDYVHRIGRTARAGRDGRAFTLVSELDQSKFFAIEKFLEREVPKEPVPSELGEAPEYKKSSKSSSNSSKSSKSNRSRNSRKSSNSRNFRRSKRPQRSKKSGNSGSSGNVASSVNSRKPDN